MVSLSRYHSRTQWKDPGSNRDARARAPEAGVALTDEERTETNGNEARAGGRAKCGTAAEGETRNIRYHS